MIKRPLILDIFALFLVCVGLSLPIQIMWIYGHPFTETTAILSKLSLLNSMVIVGAVLNALLVYKASPLLRISVPSLMSLVTLNNYIVGYVGTDYSLATTSFASLAFVGSHLAVCHPRILDLFKHPEKRWWLRPKRRRVEATILISPFNGPLIKTKTFDLSIGGAFVPFVETTKVSVNDKVNLCLTIGAVRQIRCEARVVRSTTKANGLYPQGVALAFENLTNPLRRELRRFLKAQPILVT